MTYVHLNGIIQTYVQKGNIINNIISIYRFYIDGFKNMKVGRTLWKLIFVKLAVIFIFLNHFIHDKSIKTEYKTYDEKVEFVYKNLIQGEK